MEGFGDNCLPITYQWPNKEQFRQIPRNRKIKLNQIGFVKEGDRIGILSGFKLEFTSGVESELFAINRAINQN